MNPLSQHSGEAESHESLTKERDPVSNKSGQLTEKTEE